MKNKSKREKIKIALLFGGIILIGVFVELYWKYLNSLPQNYTIGTINKIWKPASGNINAGYYYYINNKKYRNSVDRHGHEEIAKVGNRFIVEYPEGHESHGILLYDHPVPDSIEAPPEGWDEMPEF